MDQRVFSFGNPKKTNCEARNCVVIKGRYQYFTTINRPLCACLNLLGCHGEIHHEGLIASLFSICLHSHACLDLCRLRRFRRMRAVGSFNDARDYTKAELVTAWRKLAWRIAVDIYSLKTPLEISTW